MKSETRESRDGELDIQAELFETERALREINLMIEQSQGEVSKLAQRNASITAHLQQVQAKIDRTPSQEVRMAYEAALDAQQRLFVMRGQLDKLHGEKEHLERFKDSLQSWTARGGQAAAGSATSKATRVAEIEMVVNAQEAERQRLSRLMHDGPAQAMSNFILQTEIAMRLFEVEPQQAKDELVSLKASALGAFEKLRNFIFELRPMMLDDLGLAPTVRKYVDAFKDQTGIDVALTITGTERRLEPYLEVMIFRGISGVAGECGTAQPGGRHKTAT